VAPQPPPPPSVSLVRTVYLVGNSIFDYGRQSLDGFFVPPTSLLARTRYRLIWDLCRSSFCGPGCMQDATCALHRFTTAGSRYSYLPAAGLHRPALKRPRHNTGGTGILGSAAASTMGQPTPTCVWPYAVSALLFLCCSLLTAASIACRTVSFALRPVRRACCSRLTYPAYK